MTRAHTTGTGSATGTIRLDSGGGALRALGVVTLLGVAAFVLACGAAQFLRPDYDWQQVPLSFYVLGPYGPVVEASYYVLAAGLAATGVGWYLALERNARSAAPLLLFVVAAIALCVTALAFTDRPHVPPTLHGFVHVIAAMTTFLCVTVAMLVQSWRLRSDPRWRSRYRSAFVLALIAFIALWIDALVKSLPRGLSEKVVIVLILAWLWCAGWWLVRAGKAG